MSYLKNLSIIFLFIMVTYFVLTYTTADFKEALTVRTDESRCPNVLIQKGAKLYLFNSKKKEIPGVNPILFNNLEEYVEFVEFQRATGTICPVLYLQHSSEANGTEAYKIRPSPTNLQGGLSGVAASSLPFSPPPRQQVTKLLDASRNSPPFNVNSYPGYDDSDVQQGDFTPDMMLDYITQSTGLSPNPMDSNWGGADFTQALVDGGFYADNQVALKVSG
jgi:hypothetical protein